MSSEMSVYVIFDETVCYVRMSIMLMVVADYIQI